MRRVHLALAISLTFASHAQAASLSQGVAAGDLRHDAAMLWGMPEVDGLVTFQVATDAAFSDIVSHASVGATTAVAAKWDVTGLAAGTRYYYRATDSAGNSSSGQFTTAYQSGRNGLRFGVSGDWQGELAPYPALGNAAGRDLGFFVQLGDTIYAENYHAAGIPTAATLDQYRAKYAQTLTPPAGGANTLKELRQSTAVYSMIDDHEVMNDFAGGAHPATDARFDNTGSYINETQRYRDGLQAFQEAMPTQALNYGATGDHRTAGKAQLYRSQSFGQDAAMFLLDARSFRDAGLANVTDITNPAQVGAFLANSALQDRTMLGAQQLADLKAGLAAAQRDGVTWKFVMAPEPIQNLGTLAAADRFEGYAAERNEILRYIDENGIDNVVFVTADLHGTLVNDLTYQRGEEVQAALANYGNPLAAPQHNVDAWEIITGPVAFDRPLGPTIIEQAYAAGLIDAATVAYYDALPALAKEQLIKELVNAQIVPLGYSALGLADSGIPFTDLTPTGLPDDYALATGSYGWTEFEIDPVTQLLTVTTYGVPAYGEGVISDAAPQVLSRFQVAAVPEPETWATLLIGLGLLAGVARRRGRAVPA